MLRHVRAFIVCFLCVLGFGSAASAVENGGPPESGELVNEAGRLRMLAGMTPKIW